MLGDLACLLLPGDTLSLLLEDGELIRLALRQGDCGVLALADDEEVLASGGEHVAVGFLHVHNIERSGMVLSLHDHTISANVVATDGHDSVAGLVLEEAFDLVLFQVKLLFIIH